MRAARLREPKTSPAVELVPVPQPKPREVRVGTRVCGVCATDLHIIDGDTKASTPVTLGHEIAGVVDAVGAEVDSALVGQRVAVNSMIVCGECAPCRGGEPYLCRRPTILGLDRDGGTRITSSRPRRTAFRCPKPSISRQGQWPLMPSEHRSRPFDGPR
jgi:D-arabinose 1-dehydrogenase-like Zn-dependent alcohol dehydrogenase